MSFLTWLKSHMPLAGRGASLLPHASSWLTIPTPDGHGQVTHPDVCYFATPWQGFRYWMAITPYPFMDDKAENPCILVSQDGQHWSLPPGGRNPLVTTPDQGFHADPDMLYHRATDELWLYYLHTVRRQVQWLKRMRSGDGRVWSQPETLLQLDYQTIRSPALLYWQGRYWLWSVNMTGGRRLEVRQSEDGFHWSAPERVSCPLPHHTPSHVDVVMLQTGLLAMVVQATPCEGGPNPLFWRISDNGMTWHGPLPPLLTAEDGPAWSGQTLYRATLAPWDDGWGLWYGGRAPGGINHVALTPFSLQNHYPVAREER